MIIQGDNVYEELDTQLNRRIYNLINARNDARCPDFKAIWNQKISESVESANMVINAEIESQKILTANEIKQIRKNLPNKYNQTEFAKLIGASVPSVARWESRGKSHLKPNESNTIILKLLRDVPEIYWKLLYYKMKEI
jgi:DNA-binding transcriptional regulator YiaG